MNNLKDKIKDIETKVVNEIKDKIDKSEAINDMKHKIKESPVAAAIVKALTPDEIHLIKKQILDKIKAYDTIIIHRHVRPDGDCMGSVFGLRDILRTSFPEKRIFSVGDDQAEYLAFLGEEDQIEDQLYDNALVIVLDTASSNRISKKSYTLAKEIIKIDHHLVVDSYGTINYVREEMPSTTSIIMDFLKTFKHDLKMTKEGARALYVGTITDTGRFKYSSVTGDTLRLAGDMLDYGLDTEEIFAYLNIKDKETLKLQGYVLNHFITTPNGVSYIYINKRIQKKFGVTLEEASSLVNTLDSIKGSLIWILFIEADGVIRARLRSRYAAVSMIANQFSGGGHLQASGATVNNKRELKQLIAMADAYLKTFKAENEGLF